MTAPIYIREQIHHRITGNVRHTIVEHIPDPPTESVQDRFHGTGTIQAFGQDPAGNKVPVAERRFTFAIPAETIQQAWQNYDTAMQHAQHTEGEIMKRELLAAQKPGIALPGVGDVNRLRKLNGGMEG